MPIINKGTAFSNGEQLTADKINNLLDLATFNQSATDSASTTVNSASQIVVADSGVTTAKLATGAVTKSRMENVANMKALGNTSGSAASPQEVAILDENDMSSDSATSLATQQSIKAYVDSSANITATSNDNYVLNDITASGSADLGGLILKFGRFALASDDAITLTFPTAFPTACFYVHCIDTRGTGITAGGGLSVPVTAIGASSFTVNRYNEMDGTAGLSFFAIGY
mgnify:CR=1 FL=1